MYNITTNKEMLGFSSLKSYPNIFCFTTTRLGGKSKAKFASLNCSPFSGDDIECVEENWKIVNKLLPCDYRCKIIPYQTHEDNCLIIDERTISLPEKEQQVLLNGVDALITNVPKVLLTISTADCVPIVFYDPCKQVVGVAHAGWRGTVKKIALKVIQLMTSIYHCNTLDIKVCIGPSISVEAFEVGNEVVEEFRKGGFNMLNILQKNSITDKFHIDLWKANEELLISAGLLQKNIEVSGLCTYMKSNEFFSARKLGIRSGRNCTAIMLL